ncbi:hypothetical protein HYPSUDRAFT_946973 [Hypholoma sublateritium FD-334 SS-4]|uniref:Bacteriophage T5 Orf172 DNA-binding domain-containing protein n=1 Tax=Hypholoma sublateritium (strain FD-334 SS-4) TaxID=945553 RepID=A0A0D2Q714_HYPSF|nr:hypothetical protein HYPSUDRAFT_946973 [Hypholoma sublateritium FD-334 SS-4]
MSMRPTSDDIPSTPLPTPDELIRILRNLSLSPVKTFVGGFHPAYAVDPQAYYYGLGNGADEPISMPIPCVAPQPLTAQQALHPPPSSISARRLRSDPRPAPPVQPGVSSMLPTPSNFSPGKSASVPSTPVKNAKFAPTLSVPAKNTRSPSRPRSYAPKDRCKQCAGYTKKNTRCLNPVTIPPALLEFNADSPLYCHHHIKEVLIQTGFHSRKAGSADKWVSFNEWIPAYLQPSTQAALRAEMDKRASRSDENGYIYTIEIRDPAKKDTIKFKVGRSIHLAKRVDQWSRQCGSKEHVLRGFYPKTVESDDENGGILMKGRIKGGEKGPWCHRLERLIHLSWRIWRVTVRTSSPNGRTSTSRPRRLTRWRRRRVRTATPGTGRSSNLSAGSMKARSGRSSSSR